MIEENIYNFLISFPEIRGKVGISSIGFVDVPEEESYPKITFKSISKPQKYQTEDQWQRWRFYIISEDKFECQELADLLSNKLNRLMGIVDGREIDFISKIDESAIELREDNYYEMYLDFRIIFH